MNDNEDFIFYKEYNNKYFAICFLAISNIEGIKNSAYMTIYKDSDYIQQVKYNYYKMIFILISFLTFFIIYLKYRYKQMQEKINSEYIFSQQTKMAALGEMIENIAHQWRQPLSVISILASGLKLKKKCDILDDKEFFDNLDGIVNNTVYLSNTIEDFRNYFNETQEKKNFNLKNTIEQCVLMFKDDLTSKNITIIENIENIDIFSYETELKQVLINILKNTKDFMNNGFVLINAHEKNNKITIEIQDTAGGIPENIIKRIFEPYFTTKHKSVGIGLGLYTSYEIVNNRLKGDIFVLNKEFNYNFKTYKGACFSIVLYRDKL
jgi:signal transduction histidine kinase